jgi:23S rRNA (guanosine2251-2'-O)-methyltransferase
MAKVNKTKLIYLLLHNIRSVHNVGALFRTADAAGITTIYLTGYTPTPIDRFGRPVKELSKTALGGEHSVTWEYHKNPTLLLRRLRKNVTQIIGLEQYPKAIDYKKIKPKFPVLFIVGNEVDGISKSLLKKCNVIAEIPMRGKKESLNVAVATGIALFRMLNI